MFLMMFLILAGGIVIAKIMVDKEKKQSSSNKNKENTEQSSDEEETNTGFLGALGDSFNRIMGMLGFLGFVKAKEPKTAQEFIDFEVIDCGDSSMICFKDLNGINYYRMIMECGSVNYLLKTEDDQDTLDASFKRAVNAWNFPWAIYVQTRTSDNRSVVMDYKELIESTIMKYPALTDYGRKYYEYLKTDVLPFGKKTVYDNAGEKKSKSMLIKKTYIIVAYNEVSNLTEEMDESDLTEWVRRELVNRCNIVYSQLKSMDISSHILSAPELSGLIYQAFNKKTGGASDGVVSSDFLSGTVTGKSRDIDPSDLEFLINEFLNKLDVEIMSAENASFENKARAKEVERQALKLKDVLYDNFNDNNGGGY